MGGSNPYIEEVKYKPATKKYKVTFLDRKSTRLNSSHSQISYAVFCLKKKNRTRRSTPRARRSASRSCPRPAPSRALPAPPCYSSPALPHPCPTKEPLALCICHTSSSC